MADRRELRVSWSRKERDVQVYRVRGPDGALALNVLCSNPVHGPSILRPHEPPALPFVAELERRGYDITTLKFEVQLRDDHPWVKRGAIIYRQDGGRPAKVDWIRWRGSEVTVFLAPPSTRRDEEPEFEVPLRASVHAGMNLGPHMSLAEVEQMYQPAPAAPPEWSPDELPPMFPTVPAQQR